MTADPALSLSLSLPGSSSSTSRLRLEQEEWGKHVGMVGRMDMAAALASFAFGTAMPNVDCGFGDDLSLKCIIYAYPDVSGLNYKLRTSYGSIDGGIRERISETEGITLKGTSSANLKYKGTSVKSVSWYGDVFDYEGGVIGAKPAITIEENSLVVDRVVSGTIIVVYDVVRFKHMLRVFPRTGTDEKKYSSVVYGLYTGGISWVEISPPPNADSYSDASECGWNTIPGGDTEIEPPDDDGGGSGGTPDGFEPPDDVGGEDRDIDVDYCSQEVISDSAGILDK